MTPTSPQQREARLQRFSRVQSASLLASPLTPLTAPSPPHWTESSPSLTLITRPRAKSQSLPLSASPRKYNHRGFSLGADPFVGTAQSPSLVPEHIFSQQKSTAFHIEEKDEVFVRLGASATEFYGRWGDEEGRTDEWRRCLCDEPESDADEEREEKDDEIRKAGLERTKSNLSVFHDAYEHADDGDISNSPSSSSASSLASSSRRSSLASIDSVEETESKGALDFDENDEAAVLRHLAHDRWGVLDLVQSLLEWPLSSTEVSLVDISDSDSAAPPLSRIPSYKSDTTDELDHLYKRSSILNNYAAPFSHRGEKDPRSLNERDEGFMHFVLSLGSWI